MSATVDSHPSWGAPVSPLECSLIGGQFEFVFGGQCPCCDYPPPSEAAFITHWLSFHEPGVPLAFCKYCDFQICLDRHFRCFVKHWRRTHPLLMNSREFSLHVTYGRSPLKKFIFIGFPVHIQSKLRCRKQFMLGQCSPTFVYSSPSGRMPLLPPLFSGPTKYGPLAAKYWGRK